jgi:aquaporin Z
MLSKDNQSLIMEALGVFALCYVGGWSVEWSIEGSANVTAVALAHGFVLGLFVYLGASISGGHYNPAVTFSLFLTGYIRVEQCIKYILAQTVGSFIAGFALILMRPEIFSKTKALSQLGHPSLPDDVDTSIGFTCEAVAGGTLVLCVMAAGIHRKAPAETTATLVGCSLLLGVLSIGRTTGAALNPCRVIGPAFFSGRLIERGSLVYYFGPVVGGAVTSLLYKYFFMEYEDSVFKTVDDQKSESLDKPFIDN